MSKGITVRDALGKWEERTGRKPADEKIVKICGILPSIEKMDASLSMLVNCEKLSLSSNSIEKIANLNGLKNLKILSLGRNNIKSLNGVVNIIHSRNYLLFEILSFGIKSICLNELNLIQNNKNCKVYTAVDTFYV